MINVHDETVTLFFEAIFMIGICSSGHETCGICLSSSEMRKSWGISDVLKPCEEK